MERREHIVELKDYKYAIDVGSIISISDINARFTYVNENFCKISQYSAEELIGKHHSIIWSGFYNQFNYEAIKKVLLLGKHFRGEFCNMAKNGKLYWVDTTIVPFVDENGHVYQYLSFNQDITERKESEEKVRANENSFSEKLPVRFQGIHICLSLLLKAHL